MNPTTRKQVPRTRNPKLRKGAIISLYAFLFASAAIFLFPLVWMFITAFTHPESITKVPPDLLGRDYTLMNFKDLFGHSEILLWLFNSTLISLAVTFFHLFFDSLAGYAFARKDFPGKTIIFWAIISLMMIPGQVIIVPLYLMMSKLHLLDSLWAVILPGLAGPFGIFLMKQYMEGLPRDLEDAARMDGCSEVGIYRHIILPLSKPVLGTLGIFTFITYWNAFLWPLIVLNSASHYTLPVGLATLQSKQVLDYGLLMAGAVVAALPMMIVFFAFQGFFVKGIRMGALKE